jgi:hypothetical protein
MLLGSHRIRMYRFFFSGFFQQFPNPSSYIITRYRVIRKRKLQLEWKIHKKNKCTCLVSWPIKVAARSMAWTVFALSDTWIMDSNPTWDMDVCVRLFCAYAVLCAGSGLAMGWSPIQGVLLTVSRNWNSGQSPKKGCRTIDLVSRVTVVDHANKPQSKAVATWEAERAGSYPSGMLPTGQSKSVSQWLHIYQSLSSQKRTHSLTKTFTLTQGNSKIYVFITGLFGPTGCFLRT